MTTSPWDFVEDVMDALKVKVPGTGEYDAGECLTLALEEIDRLQMRDKFLALQEGEKKPVSKLDRIRFALSLMRTARTHLREAGCKNAADYTQRALKSAEGAERHEREKGDQAND